MDIILNQLFKFQKTRNQFHVILVPAVMLQGVSVWLVKENKISQQYKVDLRPVV